MKTLHYILNLPRCLFAYFLFSISKKKQIILYDAKRWNTDNKKFFNFFTHKILYSKEYRSVVSLRLRSKMHISSVLFNILFKPLESLYITTDKIGTGLFIQHGFSTIIACESIGDNFSCSQQVTIGYNGDKKPTIENNVTVCAGAIVIGGITLHNGCTIGAGAVVTKDVPENTTVVGVPAHCL